MVLIRPRGQDEEGMRERAGVGSAVSAGSLLGGVSPWGTQRSEWGRAWMILYIGVHTPGPRHFGLCTCWTTSLEPGGSRWSSACAWLWGWGRPCWAPASAHSSCWTPPVWRPGLQRAHLMGPTRQKGSVLTFQALLPR